MRKYVKIFIRKNIIFLATNLFLRNADQLIGQTQSHHCSIQYYFVLICLSGWSLTA